MIAERNTAFLPDCSRDDICSSITCTLLSGDSTRTLSLTITSCNLPTSLSLLVTDQDLGTVLNDTVTGSDIVPFTDDPSESLSVFLTQITADSRNKTLCKLQVLNTIVHVLIVCGPLHNSATSIFIRGIFFLSVAM